MPQLGSTSKKNLIGVHPSLVKVIEKAILDSPVDFNVFCGVRTDAEQKRLYSLGRTAINTDGKSKAKPMGNIVTKANGTTNRSNHQVKADGSGHAVDLYPYYNGKIQFNDVNSLRIISAHILATAKCLGVKIAWGGNWNFKDYPHFELA